MQCQDLLVQFSHTSVRLFSTIGNFDQTSGNGAEGRNADGGITLEKAHTIRIGDFNLFNFDRIILSNILVVKKIDKPACGQLTVRMAEICRRLDQATGDVVAHCADNDDYFLIKVKNDVVKLFLDKYHNLLGVLPCHVLLLDLL
jgi:hypothetical protein